MNPLPLDLSALLVILAAAAVTYGLRFGGLMLSDRLPDTGRFRRFMNALPGTILLSLVIPGIIAAGLWGCIAAAGTALCARVTGNVFISMVLGVGIVAVARWV
jgi:uncharacterized membrane protein